MAGDKRKVQEINAGSMADIAFLLLIFFLVATTMNTDTGLTRVLPPMPDPNQKQEDVKVKERNLLLVFVSKETYIMVQNELTRAFNEVRNEVAMRKFGVKFEDLNEDQRNILTKAVPLKISEAEPRNVGGKK